MARKLLHWFTGKWWELRIKYWHLPIWHDVYIGILGLFRRNLKAQVAQPDTDVVIEGFPRSANTYLVHALKLATNNEIRIAHHLHDPCQVARAARFGIPCFVILRDPLEAATSWKIKAAFLDSGLILRIYVAFHQYLAQFGSNATYIRFTDVLNHAPQVVSFIIRYVSAAMPVNLDLITDDAVFNSIDRRKRERGEVNTYDFDLTVARPTRSKEVVKHQIGIELALNEATLLKAAQEQYYALLPKCVDVMRQIS